MIITPAQASLPMLKHALEDARNRYGPVLPDRLKPLVAEIEAEIRRHEEHTQRGGIGRGGGVMSRKRAIRWLYQRHRQEWDFGWHDPNPMTRAACRADFSVAYVAEFLRSRPK